MYALRTDDGIEMAWSAAEMRRRSLLAAWRLRALGLDAGDRLLTWSPSTPRLPAVYWGAMRAGIIVVPVDLRMTAEVVARISSAAESGWLAVDTGYDAPDPAGVGLDGLRSVTLAELTADPDRSMPDDWEEQVRAWPQPDRSSIFEVHFTSGTTAHPKGVILTHGNFLESMGVFTHLIRERHWRTVSILPLSHLLEQLGTLFMGTMLGAEVVYVRSRNPRIIFETLRELRVNVIVLTPQLLELFWSRLMREVEKRGRRKSFERLRGISRRLPYRVRRLLFRPLHTQLGGAMELIVSAGAYLPPELQLAWEDVGITVMQGYGSTECGFVVANTEWHHPRGRVGRARSPTEVKIDPETSEILVKSPTLSPGYWRDEETTRASRNEDGWYKSGDTGYFNDEGDLILSGRVRNMIVLPNGLNVFPEDIEAALADQGLTQAVVLETEPGRIEAVVLPPGSQPVIRAGQTPAVARSAEADAAASGEIDRLVKAANADLSMHQRIAGWRLWPEPDFPRTHTLKIRRNEVRDWAGGDVALKVHESEDEAG